MTPHPSSTAPPQLTVAGDLDIASAALNNRNAHFASAMQLDVSKTCSWTEYEIDGSPQVYSDQEVATRNEDDINKLVVNATGALW